MKVGEPEEHREGLDPPEIPPRGLPELSLNQRQ